MSAKIFFVEWSYVCIFTYKFETGFLETQQLQPLIWCRYIGDIFFIWTHGEEKVNTFLKSLIELDLCIKFTYNSNEESINSFDIKVSLTHSFPIHPFSTPWKHQKTLQGRERVHWERMVKKQQGFYWLWSTHLCHTKNSIVFSQQVQHGYVPYCTKNEVFQ